MNRTAIFSSLLAAGLLLAPASSFAATSAPMQPAVPPDSIQSLSSELAAVAASVNSLASSTASITLPSGQTSNGLDIQSGSELKVTNVGTYHTVVPAGSTIPTVQLSKLIFQYIPCSAASPSVCTVSSSYPSLTSELALNQSTTYLNYDIQLTSLSTTSATIQVTDTTEFSNIQNELTNLSTRISALLSK